MINGILIILNRKTMPWHAGFSLIEVMVAVAILGIAMVSIHHGQAQGIRALARNKNITLATMLANEKMNEILMHRFEELPLPGEEKQGEFDPPYDQFKWIYRVESNVNFPDMIREVYLTVYWGKEDLEARTRSGLSEGNGGNKVEICMYLLASTQ